MDHRAFNPTAQANMNAPFYQHHPDCDGSHHPEQWATMSGDAFAGIVDSTTDNRCCAAFNLNTSHGSLGFLHPEMSKLGDQYTLLGLCHEECLEECQSPDCDEQDCEATLVECTDASCLSPSKECACNSNSTLCAGDLPPDVLTAAVSLQALRPTASLNGHFIPNHPTYDFCLSLAAGNVHYPNYTHPSHVGACIFTNELNGYLPFDDVSMHVPQVYHPTNQICHFDDNSQWCLEHNAYHDILNQNYYNSSLNHMMQSAEQSSRASSSPAHQTPFSFSQEPTPSSASPYASPLQTSTDSMHLRAHETIALPESAAGSGISTCLWELDDGKLCNHQLLSKTLLQQHVQEVHTAPLSKAKGFICRWHSCARPNQDKAGFAQRSKLDRHIQSHTGHKACSCEICGREFSTAQTLDSHMRTHNGEKPFKCQVPGCTYRAAQASQLTMHTRTKHTKEKPLMCDFPGCGARFAESSNLSKHKKIHLPEETCKCPHCFKTFRRQDQLKRHLKTHAKKDGVDGRGRSVMSSEPPSIDSLFPGQDVEGLISIMPPPAA